MLAQHCARAPVAAVLLALASAACAAQAPAGASASPPGRLVDVGSHRLHLHCTGEGAPAVVFESGLGGTSLDWSKVQPEVAAFTRACSYDRAGYGWSEAAPPGPRDALRIAAELDALLASAPVPAPWLLVGHSFGGLTVRAFAARVARESVAGMVFVDASHEAQFERKTRASPAVPMAPTRRTFVIANPATVPDGLAPSVKPLAQRLARAPKAVRALYAELGAMRRSARQVASIRWATDAPVVVLVRGRRADAESARTASHERLWLDLQRDLAASVHDATLEVVADSGHYIHLERPQRVANAIRTVVEAVRRARAARSATPAQALTKKEKER